MSAAGNTAIYENILVNMADGVMSLDLEGRIITFNPAAGQMLGMNPAETIGRVYAEIFFQELGLDDFNELVLRAIYESETTHSETLTVEVGGRRRRLLVSTTFLRAGNGESVVRRGVIVVFSDVTERWARERVERLFGAYLDPRIVEKIIRDGEIGARGVRQEMTILFCDLRGFTRTSERLSAEQLIDFVNAYLGVMSEPVARHGGVTDKYIGDAIMAFWGPPFTDPATHAVLTCRAALEQRSLLPQLRERVEGAIGAIIAPEEIDLHCGIATGEVVAGSIGPAQSQNFTVIGNAVNLASRLEASSKGLARPILVSEATWARASDAFEFHELEPLPVRGRSKPERVFELVG